MAAAEAHSRLEGTREGEAVCFTSDYFLRQMLIAIIWILTLVFQLKEIIWTGSRGEKAQEKVEQSVWLFETSVDCN